MQFDDTVREIRELDDDSFGPPLVDLTGAITEGRRRRRTRRIANGAISIVAVAAVLAAVPAGISLVKHAKQPAAVVTAAGRSSASPSVAKKISLNCVEQQLPQLSPGQESVLTGGDPTGRYQVGRVYDSHGPTKVVIWNNGTIAQTLSIPGSDASLTDITTQGVAVGQSYLTQDNEVSWIYSNGKLTRLPTGNDSQAAVGISDVGIVAGTEQTPQNIQYPIEWRTPTTQAQRLPLPGPDWVGQVEGIDADGTIVGSIRPTEGSGTDRGIVWRPDGTSHLLPLPVIKNVNGLRIDSISNGVIVAEAEIVKPKSSAFIPVTYTLATSEYAQLTGANLWVSSGNSSGRIAGMISIGGLGQAPAVYVPGTGVIRLPMLSATKHLANIAGWVSEDGHLITGQDNDSNGVIHAVEWHCT